MERYTERNKEGRVFVGEGMQSEANELLAKFEDAFCDLKARQKDIPAELAALRAEGKEKTVKYRELMAQKLILSSIAQFLERHGVL